MKLVWVKLKNFRSYEWEIKIDIKDMNIILGKNDIWKSTILEALDIFFNCWKWCIKISPDDLNINCRDNPENNFMEISCLFQPWTDTITLETVETSISWEYLLNNSWYIEIKKKYDEKAKESIYLRAYHPVNDEFLRNILTKKITDLQKYINENDINCEDERVSSKLRKSIRENYWDLILEEIDIPLDKEDAKKIREKFEEIMPTYALFQSDRSNDDQDDEVQNPMNIALKNVLKKEENRQKLRDVFDDVERELKNVAEWTLRHLNNLNDELASELKPKLPESDKLTREKAFWKPEIISDNIPLNKRWSGVKRLVLLAFFLNEVERRRDNESLNDIIYAFEEPETSQHPEHQQLLIGAFRSLSTSDWVQILLTTHSPYIYKDCVNDENINLIHVYINNENWVKETKNVREELNLLPYSPTRWEINYFVYNLPTVEFFDELYCRIDELKESAGIDDFIRQQSNNTIQNNIVRITDRWNMPNLTYISCIRHKIHHLNNDLNEWYTWNLENLMDKIEKGIVDMVSIIKNLNQNNN